MTYDLVPEWQVGNLVLTDYPYSVDRDSTVDIGEPEVIVETIVGSLADGDIEQERRSGNRTYSLTVYVEGADLAEVATNEAALRRELRQSGLTLTHTPGDDFAPASVYQVFVARMKVARQDPHESHLIRKVELTLTCSPFARSATLTTIPALEFPGSETAVVFDTCDSATGWTATNNGVVATVDMAWAAGAVSVHDLLTPGPQTLTLTRTGSVDFTTTKYLEAEIGYNSSLGAVPVTCVADGSRTLELVSQRLISTGRYRYTYAVSTAPFVVSSLKFSSYTPADYADLKIFELKRTNMPPSLTPRQLTRIIVPGGTERTPASIHAYSGNPAGGLGTVIVHTSPADGSGYSPPLRRWRTAGNTVTAASDTLSGSYEAIHPNPFHAEVPNSSLPAGAYALVAALKSDTAGTFSITWSTSTIVPFGTGEAIYGFTPVTFFLPNVWHFLPLEVMTLPTVASTGTAKTGIEIEYMGANPPGIIIDEAFLFRVDDDCALTMSADTPQHLWLDSAGVGGSSVPRVWWSNTADRVNQQHPGSALSSMGAHVLSPGDGTAVFMATTSVEYAPLDASSYDLWHSNAAK